MVFHKKTIVVYICMILVVLCSQSASAWILDTHDYISQQALARSGDTQVKQVIEDNYEDFIACNQLTDLSVFFYFENGLNSIGQKYKQTHSTSLCSEMSSNAKDEAQLACAYGVCAHHIQDDISHNFYVAKTLEDTYLPNSMAHIFIEEKANNKVKVQDRTLYTRQALADKAEIHKEFWRTHITKAHPDFPFEEMYDAFTAEVSQNEKYSAGFRSFIAIPVEVHIFFLLLLGANVFSFTLLFKRKRKKNINKFTMGLNIFIIGVVSLIYILFFFGNLWVFFQATAEPVAEFIPTPHMDASLEKAIQNTANFYEKGPNYVTAVIPDPTGEISLKKATASGSNVRLIVNIVLLALIAYLIYLNTRKKKRF